LGRFGGVKTEETGISGAGRMAVLSARKSAGEASGDGKRTLTSHPPSKYVAQLVSRYSDGDLSLLQSLVGEAAIGSLQVKY
jgi:hypothetical protein